GRAARPGRSGNDTVRVSHARGAPRAGHAAGPLRPTCTFAVERRILAHPMSARLVRGKGTIHMNFAVGETVVYPHHGAALIEEVKTRTVKGEPRTYLKLRVAQGDLT